MISSSPVAPPSHRGRRHPREFSFLAHWLACRTAFLEAQEPRITTLISHTASSDFRFRMKLRSNGTQLFVRIATDG
jgi:hypothetical protein